MFILLDVDEIDYSQLRYAINQNLPVGGGAGRTRQTGNYRVSRNLFMDGFR